jgi:hypothetical protein
MPKKINLDSSGLRQSTQTEVLLWRDKVYSHSTLKKMIQQSLKHACLVLFSSFCAIGVGLKCGVHPHQVFATSSSTLSNAIESYHQVNSLYDKTINCFSTLAQSNVASNDSFKVSEGERFAPNFFRLGNFNSSQLIVMYSEISFHFCKNCRIFCEGVKEAIIDTINRNNMAFGHNMAFGPASGHNLAFGLTTAFGHNLAFGLTMAFGRNLAFGLNLPFGLAMAFGLVMAFSLNDFIERILVDQNGLVGHNNLANYIGLFSRIGLVSVNGTISFIGLVGLVSIGA